MKLLSYCLTCIERTVVKATRVSVSVVRLRVGESNDQVLTWKSSFSSNVGFNLDAGRDPDDPFSHV